MGFRGLFNQEMNKNEEEVILGYPLIENTETHHLLVTV